MDKGNFQAPVGSCYPYTDGPYEPLKMDVLQRPQEVAVTSTVVDVGTYQTPPRDHIIWSLFNFGYLNFCCLGFMALVFSVKARDRNLAGDIHGAQSYGSTAKYLNIGALVLTLLFYVIVIIILATGVFALKGLVNKQAHENTYNYGSG